MPPKTIKPKVVVKATKVVAKVQPKPKKPIVTTNPRDPRLKAYKDSLSDYNKKKALFTRNLSSIIPNVNGNPAISYDKLVGYIEKGVDLNKVSKGIRWNTGKTLEQGFGVYKANDNQGGLVMGRLAKNPTTPVVYKKSASKPVIKPEPKPTVKTTPVKKEVGKENTKVRLSPKGEASKKSVDSLKNIGYGRAIGNSYKEKTGNMETYGPDASDKIKKLLNKTKKQ